MNTGTDLHTVTRLVRGRAKDWISCFYACRIPFDEKPDSLHISSPQIDMTTPGENKNETKMKKKKEKASRLRVTEGEVDDQKKVVVREFGKAEMSEEGGGGEETLRRLWPSFEEDDYIVFSFKGDDGGVCVIEERESESSSSVTSAIINSKELTSAKTNDEECRDNQVDIGESLDPTERNEHETDEVEIKEVSKTIISSEPSDSDVSSTSSFAFPIMDGEWIGSPVYMPRPDHRHHKSGNIARLQCCRFS